MQKEIPLFLKDMLIKQYGEETTKTIIEGYSKNRFVTLRINTLKNTSENIKKVLEAANIKFKEVEWYKDALIIENASENEIRKLDIYENGEIYMQSLSSMIPVVILSPKENENILDMAAAPGGKTTQIAAISDNKALITACEKNKIRAERLKYNILKQGASKINVLMEDARNLSDYFSFDKILLDAPCSGSGTISINDEKLDKIFTKELVERSEKLQYELLKKAINILKPGCEMVYSTCSILENENEKNLNKILSTGKVELIPINKENLEGIPQLKVNLEGTVCVCPNELYEGFFVAKLRKKTR